MICTQIPIKITEQEAGFPVHGEGAVLHCYIREKMKLQPERKRTAVIICPGGGYEYCSEREWEPVAMKFLNMGCQAFVLKYSTAPARFPVSLMEAAKAIELVRSRAEEWSVDKDDILMCGFSAGGHLAASIGVYWNSKELAEKLGTDNESIRPNGLILSYPVITGGPYTHEGSLMNLMGEENINGPEGEKYRYIFSLEEHVTKDVPPVFIWHTITDGSVPVENTLSFVSALRKCKVNTEAHIFPRGIHGISLANEETAGGEKREQQLEPCCTQWIGLVEMWLKWRIRQG